MVVIFLPAAALTGIAQERTGAPSTCTVQAPHCATPQPYFVPVRPTCSRITHSSGVFGSTSTSWVLPLMVKRIMLSPPVVLSPRNCERPTLVPGPHRRQLLFARVAARQAAAHRTTPQGK